MAGVAILGLALGACGAAGAGQQAELSGGLHEHAAAGAEPAPVVASTVAPATTVFVPTTTIPTTVAPGPSNMARYSGPTTTVARRPAPSGVTTHGYGDQGWEKAAASGATTVKLQVYPADIYLDQQVQVHAGVSFTGAYKASRLDFGDGTVEYGPDSFPNTGCFVPPTSRQDLFVLNPWHTYARPGTYTVTATFTTVDCTPPPNFPLVHEVIPFMPDGTPTPHGEYAPMGSPTTVSVSLPVLVWPEKVPPPVGPPPGP